MNAVEKALWFIESHFAGEITLEEIAKTAGVSKLHMTRAFGTATGLSIMLFPGPGLRASAALVHKI